MYEQIYRGRVPDPAPSWWYASAIELANGQRRAVCPKGQEEHRRLTKTYHAIARRMGVGDEHRSAIKAHRMVESWTNLSCHLIHLTLVAMECGREIDHLVSETGLALERVEELRRAILQRSDAEHYFEVPLHKLTGTVQALRLRRPAARARYIEGILERLRADGEPAPNSPEVLGWGATSPHEEDYPTSRCRSCGAEIVWAVTDVGKKMPVNAAPSERGNVILRREGGRVSAEVVGEKRAGLRVSHFTTCPNAGNWRRG